MSDSLFSRQNDTIHPVAAGDSPSLTSPTGDSGASVCSPVFGQGASSVKHEFYHRLYDVMLLSGIPIEIATKAKNPDTVTVADVEEVRALACKLIDETKFKLANINKMTILTGGE